MKLNIGAGRKPLPSPWLNVDLEPQPKRGGQWLKADAASIPLDSGCADEIQAIHLFEHFYRWEVDALLAEWRRLLQPGGKLALELPDISKAAQNLLNGDTEQMSMWAFYGDPTRKNPLMCHRWGWTPKTLRDCLERNCFENIRFRPPLHHLKGRDRRDMRVECFKP